MADALHMYRIKIFGDELPAQSQLFRTLTGPVEDLIPTAGLQDGDVIFFFVLCNLFRHAHTLAEDLHQFIIQVVDLVP